MLKRPQLWLERKCRVQWGDSVRVTNDTQPLVSVVIPTFNRSGLLRDAVRSVLDQTFRDFELIVIDDGSTDDTDIVMQGFDDSRLNYIVQPNRGRSAARNRALAMAQGQFIAFLDSDDLYLKDKLERQVAFMAAHPEVGMIYTAAICVDKDGHPLSRQFYTAEVEGDIYREVAFFQPVTITLPTVMLRRAVLDAVGVFDESMDRFEDTDLWRRVTKRFRVGILREPTCILKTHDDNDLRAQDPELINSAIDHYVAKVFREDADMGAELLSSGASRLYEYYGRAFLGVAGWRRRGFQLLLNAIRFRPMRAPGIAMRGFRTLLASSILQRGAQ